MQSPSIDRLLAVDVGNSRVKFGLFQRAGIQADSFRLPQCARSLAASLQAPFPWETIRGWIDDLDPRGIAGIIAGANPKGVESVRSTWPDWLGPVPLVVDDPRTIPLNTSVVSPERVGIDRLLNSVAANMVRPPGRPAIIVDTGTATTVDYLSGDGVFEGGAILPGFELAARSLHRYTALLPLISNDELASAVPPALGKDTRFALRSGLLWGQLGAVKELIARLSDPGQTKPHSAASPGGTPPVAEFERPLVLLTGGGAFLLAEHLATDVPDIRWEPNLSLQGLAVVYANCL